MAFIRTKRNLVAFLGALGLLWSMLVPQAIAPISVSAQTTAVPVIPTGMPAGYYIFQAGKTVQLVTHGPGDEHEFDARLHTDGTFTNVSSFRLENRDHYAVLDGGHTLEIWFHTYDFTDGLNFTVSGSDSVRLNLKLDGQLASTGEIYLEPDDGHPASNPFTLQLGG